MPIPESLTLKSGQEVRVGDFVEEFKLGVGKVVSFYGYDPNGIYCLDAEWEGRISSISPDMYSNNGLIVIDNPSPAFEELFE